MPIIFGFPRKRHIFEKKLLTHRKCKNFQINLQIHFGIESSTALSLHYRKRVTRDQAATFNRPVRFLSAENNECREQSVSHDGASRMSLNGESLTGRIDDPWLTIRYNANGILKSFRSRRDVAAHFTIVATERLAQIDNIGYLTLNFSKRSKMKIYHDIFLCHFYINS